MRKIYFDYNSTTPLDPAVLEAMRPALTQEFGNASSVHRMGQKSREAVEKARETIAGAIHAEGADLFFVSGGTEADNLALKGVSRFYRSNEKDHIVTSAIEHQAVLHPCRELETEGFKVTYVPVDQFGWVDPEHIKEAITDRTILVSVMHVNNEIGALEPVREIAEAAHHRGVLMHSDCVQSFGKIPIDAEEMGLDLVSCSAHKIYGPKGIGALYVRKGVQLKSIIHGGHQERNVRPGTENVAAIVGFGKAVEICLGKMKTEAGRVGALRDKFEKGLMEKIEGVSMNGHPRMRIFNTSNLSFDRLEGEMILMNFDLEGFFASTGSACTAGSTEPSHALLALGLSEKLARAAVRFSFGRFTTEEEIQIFLEAAPLIIDRMRRASPFGGKN